MSEKSIFERISEVIAGARAAWSREQDTVKLDPDQIKESDRKDWLALILSTAVGAIGMFAPNVFPIPIIWARGVICLCAIVGLWAARELIIHHTVSSAKTKRGRAIGVLGVTGMAVGLWGALVWASITIPQPYPFGQGALEPQHDPVSPRCANNSGGIIAGTNGFQFGSEPYSFIYLDGTPMITVQRDGDRLRILEIHVMDKRYGQVATVNNNVFWVSPLVKFTQSDWGTLDIQGSDGTEVLGIRFRNPDNIEIRGSFGNDRRTIYITDSGISLPDAAVKNTFSHNCFSGLSLIDDEHEVGVGHAPGQMQVLLPVRDASVTTP